jgi:C4-dicarboxylate-specific signal transduction histidine kinase
MINCLSGDLKQRCDEAIGMVSEGTKRATEIVKALMTFSYRGTPVLKHANINNIIDNTLLFLKINISPDIEIRKKYHLTREIPIYTDKIHQVVMIILDNAIYAVNQRKKKNKKITIATNLDDNLAVITISNNGPAISDEHINQIFDPFFTTKAPDEGAGLGLSICYTLIAEHNGSISVKNDNEGVSFIIGLPVRS